VTTLDPFAYDDGAYVLGALSDAERTAFEQHLADCPACSDRVNELMPLPALLAGVPASAYEDALEGPPDTLLPGLLRQLGAQRRRRHWLTTGLGGLAAACLVALAVLAWPTGHTITTPGSGTPPAQAMSALVASPVHATAALSDVSWGTKIEVTCRYDLAPHVDADYWLVVVDKQNHRHTAGSWRPAAGKVMQFIGGTALPRDQISSVLITYGKTPILRLTL
jgi:Putative zinc-finger